MTQKPPTCDGCALADRSSGYAPAVGPTNAPVLLIGEALGFEESKAGEPFVGPAGSMLNRLLSRNQWDRRAFRIDNVCRCFPPKGWFDEHAPWYFSARRHCTTQHLARTLEEGHQVIVSLGATALKHLLGRDKAVRIEDWHGTVTPTPHGWLVPTYHPSHLQRGAMNLFGTVCFDLQRAHQVAREGWTQEAVSLIVDPPLEWFRVWVEQVEAAVARDPTQVWLSTDIETPDTSNARDEGTLGQDDRSYQILRVNFAVCGNEAVTIPYCGPFVGLIDRLIRLPCLHGLWNKEYDDPRLERAGHTLGGDRVDWMWGWHVLQSDLPRGLGFVSSFYSTLGAWKHLATTDPGRYAALDALQTWRVGVGIAKDLERQGMWEAFWSHTHRLHTLALKPAQQVGVKIDRPRLEAFIADLDVKQRRLLHEMQGLVPEQARPLTPKQGLVHPPPEGRVHSKASALTVHGEARKDPADSTKQELYALHAVLVDLIVPRLLLCCRTCGAEGVTKSHRCPKTGLPESQPVPDLYQEEKAVPRWFWREPFNPDSPDQILAYMAFRGHSPGRAKKTGADSTDHETLARLAAKTKDPLYSLILRTRAVGKIKGTYGEGTRRLLDADDRTHPVPSFKPSMGRLSYASPNPQNVVADKDATQTLASGFRSCIIADPGCRLLEIDFAGIEALISGWCMQDAGYIRLAKLGVHAALAAVVTGHPHDPSWSDSQIAAYFKQIKARDSLTYDRCKRTVHGTNYGLSEFGMVRNFPEIFPTLTIAKKYRCLYDEMAPALPRWHNQLRERAHRQGYLGGPGEHPYGYRHFFWDVIGFRAIPYALYLKKQRAREAVSEFGGRHYAVVLGADAKRVVAFLPQSIASGVLKEAMLRLFNPENESYIGDLGPGGRTPLLFPVHDSLVMNIPIRTWDSVVERVFREMLRPIRELPLEWVPLEERNRLGLGPYLSIGTEGKAGVNWAQMEVIPSPSLQELGLAPDGGYQPVEMSRGYGHQDQEEEDEVVQALATSA